MKLIPEISAAETDDFWHRYVLPRRPVVIRGLFAGQPVAELATLEAARRGIGHMPVLVQLEYTRRITGGDDPAQPHVASLADWLDDLGSGRAAGRVVTEFDVPPALLSQFSIPAWCRPSTPSHDLYLHAFVAGRGDFAHVHFDMDQRHVLLVQVFGRKRVVVFPASAAPWMHSWGNFGSIRLEAMTDAQRDAFIACAGGAQTVLEPTDAVLMPLLVWHYVDYLDTGLSFNIRFGRNAYNSFLSVENFIADEYLQAVAEPFGGLAPGEHPSGDLAATFDDVVSACNAPYGDRMEKYRAMRQTFRDIAVRNGSPPGGFYLFGLDERTERYAEENMRGNLLYRPNGRPPEVLSDGEQPLVSERQLRMITAKLADLEYSPAAVDGVLRNKFGRSALSELRRNEAIRLLAYLGSPSGLTHASGPGALAIASEA